MIIFKTASVLRNILFRSLIILPLANFRLGIGLSLGGATGYAINPARDLSPRIAPFILPIPGKRDSDWSYAWVPIIGPIAGVLAAAYAFKLLMGEGGIV